MLHSNVVKASVGAALALSMLAGCGAQPEATTTEPQATEQTTTTDSKDATSQDQAKSGVQGTQSGDAAKDGSATTDAGSGSGTNASSNANAGTSTTTGVSQNEAKEAALAKAGYTESEVTSMHIKKGTENGQEVWEVSFSADGMEFDYDVDVATGKIVSTERDTDDDARTSGGTTGTTSQSGQITSEAAEANALSHAGIAREEAAGLRSHLDTENGTAVYEVDFTANGTEYSYDIDATTGGVLTYDTEPVDND